MLVGDDAKDDSAEVAEVEEPVILEPAFRHGMEEQDMLRALQYEKHHVVEEDGMAMFIGPDRRGR